MQSFLPVAVGSDMRRLNGNDSLVRDRSQSVARPWHTKLQTPVVGASPTKKNVDKFFKNSSQQNYEAIKFKNTGTKMWTRFFENSF